MTNPRTLNAAADSTLALAACLAAAGGNPDDLTSLALLMQAAAKRVANDETLIDAATVWRGFTTPVRMPVYLAPWAGVHTDSVEVVHLVAVELAAVVQSLRPVADQISDIWRCLKIEPDSRRALTRHVLTTRAAGTLQRYEKHEAARIAQKEFDARVEGVAVIRPDGAVTLSLEEAEALAACEAHPAEGTPPAIVAAAA